MFSSLRQSSCLTIKSHHRTSVLNINYTFEPPGCFQIYWLLDSPRDADLISLGGWALGFNVLEGSSGDSNGQPGLKATVIEEGPCLLIYRCLCIQCNYLLCHNFRLLTISHPLTSCVPLSHLNCINLSFLFSKIGIIITIEGHCGDLTKIYRVVSTVPSIS